MRVYRGIPVSHTGTSPIIIHAPGQSVKGILWDALERRVPQKQCHIHDLTIVTWNSGNGRSSRNGRYTNRSKLLGRFENSLEKLGVPVHVLGLDSGFSWRNSHKIPLTLKFIESVTTKYLMCCDSSDVIALDSPQIALDRFLQMECEVLYNGEMFPFRSPHSRLYGELTKEWEVYEESIGRGPFKYINSGAFIGRTDTIQEVYQRSSKVDVEMQIWLRRVNDDIVNSDQARLKCVFPEMYPRMQVDYDCEVFQTICGVPDIKIL